MESYEKDFNLSDEIFYLASIIKCKKSIVNHLKCLYYNQINSVRKYEEIENINDLMVVLKKRNCLTVECLDILKNLRHTDNEDFDFESRLNGIFFNYISKFYA